MKSHILAIAFIGAMSGALAIASFSLGLFSGLESFFEDLFFTEKAVSRHIVIADIDNESINTIGQWPWPRSVFAKAIIEMSKNPPQTLGIDVIFPEHSRIGIGDDNELARALQSASYPIIMPIEADPLSLQGEKPSANNFVRPLPEFASQRSVTLAHVNLILDRDGIVRKFPPKIFDRTASTTINAFSYEAARKSGYPIPNEEDLLGMNRIVFAGPTGSILRIPFWKILDGSASELVKGKIVFLGATAADLHDEKPTPLGRGTEMPGVEIQANIANMLISGYRLTPLHQAYSNLWILIAALLPALIFIVLRHRTIQPILINIFFGGVQTLAVVFAFESGVVANIIHINGAWILSTSAIVAYRYFFGERERAQMRKTFSKYVSKDVLEEILKHPEMVKLGGEEKEITVFFSDIRGFTTISEKTTPKELVRILNEYFTSMSEEVLNHKGVLDKYIGDAIMAFWGAPIEDPDQADNALRASIAMMQKLKILNEKLQKNGDPEINIGIGLYTGPAIVGNIGSEMRFDYTIIGDTVNVASRLEGLNKEFKTNIIIGESTKNKLRGAYSFKPLGSVSVKGRKEPLNIYTVDGEIKNTLQ
ncbi:MAG: adenylate/guanylate cyclase domain-containing protein [Patescibacteria group bacterium]